MSEEIEAVDTSACCATCGIAEVDDVKLVPCDGCDLVKYCGDECQELHKSEHEEVCKMRAAELHDELLFKQPEGTHMGDCPICMIPLPFDRKKSTLMTCCSKVICGGCEFASEIQNNIEARHRQSCPFCRKPQPDTFEESSKQRMKRVEMNDPVAMCQEGINQHEKGEYQSAFESFSKAAKLGDAEAHYMLAGAYHEGHGVEKEEGKIIHHLEEAAILGHPEARYHLGSHECLYGNAERAVKHWIISATQGYDVSMKALMEAFKDGLVQKEELAAVLRAHHAAVDETKSPEREAAEVLMKNNVR